MSEHIKILNAAYVPEDNMPVPMRSEAPCVFNLQAFDPTGRQHANAVALSKGYVCFLTESGMLCCKSWRVFPQDGVMSVKFNDGAKIVTAKGTYTLKGTGFEELKANAMKLKSCVNLVPARMPDVAPMDPMLANDPVYLASVYKFYTGGKTVSSHPRTDKNTTVSITFSASSDPRVIIRNTDEAALLPLVDRQITTLQVEGPVGAFLADAVRAAQLVEFSMSSPGPNGPAVVQYLVHILSSNIAGGHQSLVRLILRNCADILGTNGPLLFSTRCFARGLHTIDLTNVNLTIADFNVVAQFATPTATKVILDLNPSLGGTAQSTYASAIAIELMKSPTLLLLSMKNCSLSVPPTVMLAVEAIQRRQDLFSFVYKGEPHSLHDNMFNTTDVKGWVEYAGSTTSTAFDPSTVKYHPEILAAWAKNQNLPSPMRIVMPPSCTALLPIVYTLMNSGAPPTRKYILNIRHSQAEVPQILQGLQLYPCVHGLLFSNVSQSRTVPFPEGQLHTSLLNTFQYNKTLQQLELVGYSSIPNFITGAIGSKSTGLGLNTSLVELDLSDNNLRDAGAVALASALRGNRTLTSLRFDRNNVSLQGYEALRGSLYGNKKLCVFPRPSSDISSAVQIFENQIAEAQRLMMTERANMKQYYKPRQYNAVKAKTHCDAMVREKVKMKMLTAQSQRLMTVLKEIDSCIAENSVIRKEKEADLSRRIAEKIAIQKEEKQREKKHQSALAAKMMRAAKKEIAKSPKPPPTATTTSREVNTAPKQRSAAPLNKPPREKPQRPQKVNAAWKAKLRLRKEKCARQIVVAHSRVMTTQLQSSSLRNEIVPLEETLGIVQSHYENGVQRYNVAHLQRSKLPMPPGWVELVAPNHSLFYRHADTGYVTWEDPRMLRFPGLSMLPVGHPPFPLIPANVTTPQQRNVYMIYLYLYHQYFARTPQEPPPGYSPTISFPVQHPNSIEGPALPWRVAMPECGYYVGGGAVGVNSVLSYRMFMAANGYNVMDANWFGPMQYVYYPEENSGDAEYVLGSDDYMYWRATDWYAGGFNDDEEFHCYDYSMNSYDNWTAEDCAGYETSSSFMVDDYGALSTFDCSVFGSTGYRGGGGGGGSFAKQFSLSLKPNDEKLDQSNFTTNNKPKRKPTPSHTSWVDGITLKSVTHHAEHMLVSLYRQFFTYTIPHLTLVETLADFGQPAPSLPLTVITQCSVDRLDRLTALLHSLDGNLSVSVTVFAQTAKDICEAKEWALHEIPWLEALPLGSVKIALYQQQQTTKNDDFYPINALRNKSLDACDTPYVFHVDVDFICCEGFASKLHSMIDIIDGGESMEAYVIPAFEFHPSEQSSTSLPKSMSRLRECHRRCDVSAFHVHTYPKGHRATESSRWFSNADIPYEVTYEEGYEPYLIFNRATAPKFDERFVGYGLNKIQHVLHMHALGFRFFVLPSVFVVCREHAASLDRERMFSPVSQTPLQRLRIQALFERFKEDLGLATDKEEEEEEGERNKKMGRITVNGEVVDLRVIESLTGTNSTLLSLLSTFQQSMETEHADPVAV